jgi:hypothetical protein
MEVERITFDYSPELLSVFFVSVLEAVDLPEALKGETNFDFPSGDRF